MVSLREIRESFLHLLFPHICSSCGSDNLNRNTSICLRCLEELPETNFERYPGNPLEKKFRGRIPLEMGSAHYYFTNGSRIQQLLHQLKYKSNLDLGLQLGRIMGDRLLISGRFAIDALVPLPLFPARERKRGYNQAAVLCEGISEVLKIPVLKDSIIRSQHTDTQTKKGRIERWQNMEGKFVLTKPETIREKHVLLVDDVVTTGATLESCGTELLTAENLTLSIATLCYANR